MAKKKTEEAPVKEVKVEKEQQPERKPVPDITFLGIK